MPTVILPALVAGRDLAADAVSKLDAVEGNEVVVDARALSSGSASFAAALVNSILIERGAKRLVLVGAPDRFARYVGEAADRLAVSGRFSAASAMPTAV